MGSSFSVSNVILEIVNEGRLDGNEFVASSGKVIQGLESRGVKGADAQATVSRAVDAKVVREERGDLRYRPEQ